jgi:hypothetical protein
MPKNHRLARNHVVKPGDLVDEALIGLPEFSAIVVPVSPSGSRLMYYPGRGRGSLRADRVGGAIREGVTVARSVTTKIYDHASGGAEHCQLGAQTLWHADFFDWMSAKFDDDKFARQ